MIDIKYILKENDFLVLNLYYFKSEGKLRMVILKTWIAYIIIMAILMGFLIWKNEEIMAIILLTVVAIISVFHSTRMKNMYLRKFKKSIKQYENRFGKEVQLKLTDSQFQFKSIAGETNLNMSQIDSISETQDYFFVKFKIEAAIIPKTNLPDINYLKENLRFLAEKLRVRYSCDMNWKW